VVTAKTGFLRVCRKQQLNKLFPTRGENVEVGEQLIGYISSSRLPSKSHAMWIHFGGMFQAPVSWKYVHDLRTDTVRMCIQSSFVADEHEDEDEDVAMLNVDASEFAIYSFGDLVMAKVLHVEQVENPMHSDENMAPKRRQNVTLSMKPSDLLPSLSWQQQTFFCKTFLSEWYLLYKQKQNKFIQTFKYEQSENAEIETGKTMKNVHDLKADLNALQIGQTVQCRVAKLMEDEPSAVVVVVEFKPQLIGVTGMIRIHSPQTRAIYEQRVRDNAWFKCNIVNIEWSEEHPVVELYDPIHVNPKNPNASVLPLKVIHEVSDANDFGLRRGVHVNAAQVIYVHSTHVLVQFAVTNPHVVVSKKGQTPKLRFIGVVPLRLPYMFVPTTVMFRVGDVLKVDIIEASNQFGGVVLCNIRVECFQRFLHKYNRMVRAATHVPSVQTECQKRKLSDLETDENKNVFENAQNAKNVSELEPVSKKQKIMVNSAKSNILGVVFSAQLVASNAQKRTFSILAHHDRLANIHGVLPYAHLCDNFDISSQLAESYHALLSDGNVENIENIKVVILSISDTNSDDAETIVFTAKNMIVSHCENRAFPRFHAYQIAKNADYQKLKRSVPMLGFIDHNHHHDDDDADADADADDDTLTVCHGYGVRSRVDFEKALLLPFDASEIASVYRDGQTVIGHIDAQCKLAPHQLSLQLCRTQKLENYDIIVTNQSFVHDYKTALMAQKHRFEADEADAEDEVSDWLLLNSDIEIGNVLDVTLTQVTPTLLRFEYQGGYRGVVLRPEHCGVEIEAFVPGMCTQVLVLDVDYARNTIVGSIRLASKTPQVLNQAERQSLMNEDAVKCQLELVSENGYLVLQILATNQFVLVPIATPYFQFTRTQMSLYFKIGARFECALIESCSLLVDDAAVSSSGGGGGKNVFLGHVPALIRARNGYLSTRQIEIISNASKYYKPYDSRFTHPAQILYAKHDIEALTVKLCATTVQGHVAEIAPGFYPKIVIPAPDEEDDEQSTTMNEMYLILEDKVDTRQCVQVNIAAQLLRHETRDREIVVSVQNIILDDENEAETSKKTHMKTRPISDTKQAFRCGQIVDIVVESVTKDGIYAHIVNDDKLRGFIPAIHCDDSAENILQFQRNPNSFRIGGKRKAVILDRSNRQCMQLSLQASLLTKYRKMQQNLHLLASSKKTLKLEVGQELNAIVTKIVPAFGLFVDLGVFGIAQLHITNAVAQKDLSQHARVDLTGMFSVHQIVKTRVLKIIDDDGDDGIEVSIRHVQHPNHNESPLHYGDVVKGSLVSGVVSMVDERMGVIVWLSRKIKGRISLKHLSGDRSVTYAMALKQYPIGCVIRDLSVLFVSTNHKRVELSLANAADSTTKTKTKTKKKVSIEKATKFVAYKLHEMDVGDFMNVLFQKRFANGDLLVFVPSSDFKYGVIPKTEIASHLLQNDALQTMIKGDRIQCWVLKIMKEEDEDEEQKEKEKEKNRHKVRLTMKMSSLQQLHESIDFSAKQLEDMRRQKRKRVSATLMREYQKLQQLKKKANGDGGDDDGDEEEDAIKPLGMTSSSSATTTAMASESAEKDEDEDVDCEDDAVMELDTRPTSTRQPDVDVDVDMDVVVDESAATAANDEEEIAEWNELMKAEGFTAKPQTPKEFEKLLIASPDSSIIWIQYIAFYLSKKNIVKARQLIQRALDEINVSIDKERLNVWIAWMNLEMLYGTEAALIQVFQRALRSNDEKEVYTQFVGVCQENKKYALCHKYYTEMLHKFRTDTHVYIHFGAFLYQRFADTRRSTHLDEARDLLKRGIQCLPIKMQHVSLIQKFAWFEYKYVNALVASGKYVVHDHAAAAAGANEGQNMFEGLLRKHGNKPHIWKTYAMAVYKFDGDVEHRLQTARNLFERGVSHARMKTQDTKWLFKEYLNFENKFGQRSHDHKQNVTHIKELAKQYVSTINANRN